MAQSSLFNLTISRSNPHEWNCPGITNAVFATLDSSVPYVVNASLNAALAVVTTVANLVVLLAMRRVTSIRPPSKLLLCSLVLTDLGAGLVLQPQFAALLLIKAIYPGLVQCELFKSFYFTAVLFNTASCFTMTAISLDRYAALFFQLKYQQIVTTRRVCAFLAFIWSLSIFFASTVLWNKRLLRVLSLTGVTVVLFAISTAYIKIYRRLMGKRLQAPDQQAGNSPNMERYRTTAFAMMLVYVLFVICYVPYLCFRLVAADIGYTALIVCLYEFAYTLVLLNSFFNPLVYCLKLPEVRTEVVKLLRKVCCCPQQ